MDYKKGIIVLLLAIFLFSITSVCASEIDDSIASEDTNQIKLSDNDKVIEDNVQTSEKNSILAQTNNVETLVPKMILKYCMQRKVPIQT